MEKIRSALTKKNLEFLNRKGLSITKVLNNLVEYMRIKDALGEENELYKDIQELIRKSKKS